ncbi:protein of unknown function DUF4378, partial [Dillenia turbinata]
MGAEKESSKGGYVGGFLQLFDWKVKSRKKLFSGKSELPERTKQGKRSNGNLPMTRINLTDDDEIGAGSSIKESSEYSCAFSVISDDAFGSRAPGVVARLMGLDSLPTTNFLEPYSTPLFDAQSLHNTHYRKKSHDFHDDHQIMHFSGQLNKVDAPAMNAVESRPQKTKNRPIEKFQTEMLPPKSAKTIPVTHHKLLSPIKSPGFIPTKDAAHIMEAAAKIIEQGPHVTMKSKLPLVGSSSVPLKVRDLKEKVEATQRPSRDSEASRRLAESNAAKCLKGQALNKSWNGSVSRDISPFRISPDRDDSTVGPKNKEKSISLAIQAKVNVQKREGLNPNSSRHIQGQKEQNEIKSTWPLKSQLNTQKSTQKKISPNTSTALKQNNQKQNCPVDNEKVGAKPSQSRKIVSGDPSVIRYKSSSKLAGNSKAASRKMALDVMDHEKEASSSRRKNLPRKKRSIDRNFQLENSQAVESENAIQTNAVADRRFKWADDSRIKSTEVVSFTFTAPLTRSVPASEPSTQMVGTKFGPGADSRGKAVLLDAENTNLSSLGYNVVGGDALGALLEQKLKELTYGVQSSHVDPVKPVIVNPSIHTSSSASSIPGLANEKSQDVNSIYRFSSQSESCSLSNPPPARANRKLQGCGPVYGILAALDMKMGSVMVIIIESLKFLESRHPSPVSTLEPPCLTESCNSSDSTDSNSAESSKLCSSVQAKEMLGMSFSMLSESLEADTEISDSASSAASTSTVKMSQSTLTMTNDKNPIIHELEYVKEVLSSVELMFQDFALGRAHEIINPHLYEQLECWKADLESDGDEGKLQRKLLFDCVSECMDLRCRRYVGGGCKAWAKGLAMMRRKERLAEEVYKDISGWQCMGDFLVDELVYKDMSSQHGKWLDFEAETFVLGLEIESRIFNSLVREVVADVVLR